MVEKKAFPTKPKHQYRVSQCGAHDFGAQSKKEWRLLRESKFYSFDLQILIIRKMVKRKPFLAKPKH